MKRKHLLMLGGAAVGGYLLYRSTRRTGLGFGLLQADAGEDELSAELGKLKAQQAALIARATALPTNAAQQHLSVLKALSAEGFKNAAQLMMVNDTANAIATLNAAGRIIEDETAKIAADEGAVKAGQVVTVKNPNEGGPPTVTYIKPGAGADVMAASERAMIATEQEANEPARVAAEKGVLSFAAQKGISTVTGTAGDVLGTIFKTIPWWLYVAAIGGTALWFFGPQLLLKVRKYRKAAAPLPEPAMQANPRRRRRSRR